MQAACSRNCQLNVTTLIMPMFPKTTPQQYLTGVSVLNFPYGLNTNDRREDQISLPLEEPLNELLLASSNFDLGIFNCAEILDAHGIPHEESSVWVATHARVIADMLLFSASRNLTFDPIMLNEWTNWESQLELMQILDLELTLVPLEQKQRILEWVNQKLDEYRASVQALIASSHADDEMRVRSGQLHPDSLFFIPREKVKQMTVVWNNDPSLFDKL